MTTSSIAASNVRSGAAGTKPREGAEGQGFSAVLSLRLGMGLNAAVGVAQIVPQTAQKPTVEIDRTPGAQDAERSESEIAKAEEASETGRAASTDEDDERAETAIPTAEGKKITPEVPAKEQDSAGLQAKTATDQSTPTHAEVTHTKAVGEVQGPVASKSEPIEGATRSEAVATETRIVKNEPDRLAPAGSARRGADRAPSEEVAAEPVGAARDPLGLIRDRSSVAEVESRAVVAESAKSSKAEPASDVFSVRVGQVEPARSRFADSVESASAARAASSGAVPVTNAPAVPQGIAQATAARPAVVGVSGVGSTGGSGVGGAGVGSGGGGAASDFGGLFNSGGRAFGVAFGAAVRSGKGAVSVAGATKGESKEQIQAQMSRGLAAALRQKGGVMSLRLNPEHLGSMKIDLTIENGRVTAVFDAQSEQARQILREGVDGLKRSIEQSGLIVKSIEVVGVTTLAAPEPTRPGEGSFQGTPGQHYGDQSGGGQRSHGEPRSGKENNQVADELEAIGAAEGGGVWAESDGSASGLLRLRVDAVV